MSARASKKEQEELHRRQRAVTCRILAARLHESASGLRATMHALADRLSVPAISRLTSIAEDLDAQANVAAREAESFDPWSSVLARRVAAEVEAAKKKGRRP